MANSDPTSKIATITFDLHSGRTLRASLHLDVSDPYAVASRTASYGNRNDEHGGDESDEGRRGRGGRFGIVDAARIVSLSHLAVAANAALMRSRRRSSERRRTDEEGGGGTSSGGGGGGGGGRTLAQDTIVFVGGSSHAGNVLRDYGFLCVGNSFAEGGERVGTGASSSTTGGEKRPILAFAYDCRDDDEYETFLAGVGLAPTNEGGTLEALSAYLERDRTEDELKDLLKTYKLTREEVEMEGSSLEHAVVTRIATKYIV